MNRFVTRQAFGLVLLASTPALAQGPSTDAQRHEDWRAAIARTPTPSEGCFAASYPDAAWKPVACKAAPNRPYIPRNGGRNYTVGDGNDDAAVVGSIITTAPRR